MNFPAQGFTHLPAADIGDCMQGQAVEELVVIQQVFSYAVYNQVQKLVFLVEEQSHG